MIPSPWILIKQALIKVFTQAAVDQIKSEGGVNLPFETPEWAAEWQNRRVAFIHPGQGHALYLKITGVEANGWDDSDYIEQDTGLVQGKPATGIFDVFQRTSGMRRITLQVQDWSLTDTDELSSFDVIERVRGAMDFNSSRQILLDANIDYTDMGKSRDMTATIESKRFSITAVDFVFTACVIQTDSIQTGYIARVILSSHPQAGSVDVPDVLRMIQEPLPA